MERLSTDRGPNEEAANCKEDKRPLCPTPALSIRDKSPNYRPLNLLACKELRFCNDGRHSTSGVLLTLFPVPVEGW